MKKILTCILAAALAAGSLIGCTSGAKETTKAKQAGNQEESNTAGNDGKKVKLVIWGAVPDDKGPQQVCDNYNALNTGVEVEYVRYVNDEQGNVKLDTALISGEQIDIFFSYGAEKREKRVSANLALDLSELCKQYDIDVLRDFGEVAENNITEDGKIYAIPTYKQADFIMVNKDMFEQAGIEIPKSWTWEELSEVAKQLTVKQGSKKVYGFLKSTDGNVINTFVATNGNKDCWINEDGKTTNFVSNESLKKGYEVMNQMMYVDGSMMTWEDMIVQKVSANEAPIFFNGEVAMVAAGSHHIRNIKDVATFPRDFKVGFVEIPSLSAEQKTYYAAINTQDDMSINVKSKYKEEAMAFIKWYYTEGYDPMIEGGRIPLYQNYNTDRVAELLLAGAEDLVDIESFQTVMFKKYDNMQYDVNNTGKAEIAKIMKEEMEAYFLKQYDLNTALENMQSRCDEVLVRQ